MTLGEMKQRVRSLLGLSTGDEPQSIYYAIDSTARRVAYVCKMIIKTGTFTFTDGELDISTIPTDFICLAGDGETSRYYAYPPAVSSTSGDSFALGYDGIYADAVAYGAAAELCTSLYPGDVRRYMELATSYDERLIEPVKLSVTSTEAPIITPPAEDPPADDDPPEDIPDDTPDDTPEEEQYAHIGNALDNPVFSGHGGITR